MVLSKVCIGCDQRQLLTEFYTDKRTPDDRASRCKKCMKSPREKAKRAFRMRERMYTVKAWVLAILGDKCSVCGKSGWMFLTLDHIGGGGAKHRAELGTGAGHRIRVAVLKEGCPPKKYRTLCFNCNCAIHNHGEYEVRKACS